MYVISHGKQQHGQRLFARIGVSLLILGAMPLVPAARSASGTGGANLSVNVCPSEQDMPTSVYTLTASDLPATTTVDAVTVGWSIVSLSNCDTPALEYQAQLFVGSDATPTFSSAFTPGLSTTISPISTLVTLAQSGTPIRFRVIGRKANFPTQLLASSNEVSTTVLLPSPEAPTVNPPISPTSSTTVTLSGTKPVNTAVYWNSFRVADFSADTTWSGAVTIPAGTSTSAVTTSVALHSQSSYNFRSPTVSVDVTHPILKPGNVSPLGTITDTLNYTCTKQPGTGVRASVNGGATVEVAALDTATECAGTASGLLVGANTLVLTAFNAASEVSEPAIVTLTRTSVASCGNGIVESAEQCDDGNTSNTDACTNSCLTATCGDGYIRAGVEACEPPGSSGCSLTCQIAVTIASPTVSTPTSPTNKTTITFTGTKPANTGIAVDGALRVAVDSATTWTTDVSVDGGTSVKAKEITIYFAARDASGNASPTIARTVVVPLEKPSKIDLPSTTSASSLDFNCKKQPGTGVMMKVGSTETELADVTDEKDCDGSVSLTVGSNSIRFWSFNDDGEESSKLSFTVTRTNPAPVCGNSIIEAGEQCDDGNAIGTDACVGCRTAFCGDSVIRAGNEACEPPNTSTCNATCQTVTGTPPASSTPPPASSTPASSTPPSTPSSVRCGNGIVEAGEQCDDGNTANTDACLASCQVASCGDGFLRANVEQCEPPGTATCSITCKVTATGTTPDPVCGNGSVETGEACDPPDGISCSSACQGIGGSTQISTVVPATCGNGVQEAGEACDPPDGLTCSASCSILVIQDPIDEQPELPEEEPDDEGVVPAPAETIEEDPAVRIACHSRVTADDFSDVDPGSIEYPYIQDLKETYSYDQAPILRGPRDPFILDGLDVVTRGEVTELALRAFCIEIEPLSSLGAFRYPDVPDSDPHARAIYTAAMYGIVTGYPSGKFYPEHAVRRDELLQILLRAAAQAPAFSLTPTRTYADTTVESPFAREIHRAREFGDLLLPYSDDRLSPGSPVLRKDLAVAVDRLLRWITGLAETVEPEPEPIDPNVGAGNLNDIDGDGLPDDWEQKHFGDLTSTDGTQDHDADELTDRGEFEKSTDPWNWDTDGDTLADGEEALTYRTEPLKKDTDGDTFSDGIEILFKTDPLDPNSHPEITPSGVPSSWVKQYYETPPSDIDLSIGDRDGDGLSDLLEYRLNTNPTVADTDGDGISDGEEVNDYHTDPLSATTEAELTMLRITSFYDSKRVSFASPIVRGTGPVGLTVDVSATPENGSPIALGTATIDAKGKWVLRPTVELADGVYTFVARVDVDGKTLRATVTGVTIDTTLKLAAPDPKKLDEQTVTPESLLSASIVVDSETPLLTGITREPGSTVYAVWQSLVYTSSLVSDSQQGNFSVRAPRPLGLGEHHVTVYAVNTAGIQSPPITLPFQIAQAAETPESAPQKRGLPWWMYAIYGTGGTGFGTGLWWWKRRRKDEEG